MTETEEYIDFKKRIYCLGLEIDASIVRNISEHFEQTIKAERQKAISDTKNSCKKEFRKYSYYNEWESTTQLEEDNYKGEDYSQVDKIIDDAEVEGCLEQKNQKNCENN